MSKQNNNKTLLSRRQFLKIMGIAGVATTSLAACIGNKDNGDNTIINRRHRPARSVSNCFGCVTLFWWQKKYPS